MSISRFSDRMDTIFRFLIVFLVFLIGGWPTLAYALPQGGSIASGAGTIDTSGSSLTVTQTTNKIIINWESFSIGNNESVIFVQPDSSSSALNNVLGTSRTVVEGNLAANGQIVLSNPNGIFISPDANVNVASLIASTLKISEQDFLDGLYQFSQDPSKPLASILNEGKIRASDFAALIAPSVDNKGVVIANLGTVGLVSGEAATVDFVGDNLIKFTVNEPVEGQVLDKDGNLISDRISNSGSIQADGGQVFLSAKNASNIIKDVVNMDGVIEAKTVTEKNGRIFLGGGDQGAVNVAGILNASGEESGEQGGEVTIEGADVIAQGSILAKGTDAKGGNITITGTNSVDAGGTTDVSGETGGNVNITTGGLSLAAPVLAKGTTGEGGNININTLFKSWEAVNAMLDVSGASGGTIQHFAGQQITTSGKYIAIGTDGKGGSIDVTANTIELMSNTIDASGTMGGGGIRLGGEYQGGKNLAVDEILNAKFLFMNDAANITARTTGTDGAGGRVIVWADQNTFVSGQFDVTPGTESGAGGFVEVSSDNTLVFNGMVRASVDDRKGSLLLDPKGITVKTNCGAGFNASSECKGISRITDFTKNFEQNVSTTPQTITDVLDAGTDVELQAYRDINIEDDITVNNTGGDGGNFSMRAGRRIVIQAAITTDNGDLTLDANNCTGVGSCTNSNRRGTGEGHILMDSGASINTGTGDFTATVGDEDSSGDITLRDVTTTNLVVTNNGTTSGSDILDEGGLTVSGTSAFTTVVSGGVITLDAAHALTGAVTLNTNSSSTSAHATLDNGTTALNLAASTIGGNLTLTTGNVSGITDSGAVTVGGNLVATTDANSGVIDLGTTLVTGTVALTTNGSGNATFDNDSLNIDLAASNVGGNLTVTTGNASGITDSGTVTVGGNLVATTDANSGVINLDSMAVDGTFTLSPHSTGAVTVVNDAGLDLAASTMGGTFSGTATTGNITDTGALAITGTTTLVTSANDATITLNNTSNAFTGAMTITTNDTSGDVTIDGGTTALNIGASTIDGDLTLTTGNVSGITDSGTVTVGGNLVATTDANNGVITLDSLAVDGTIAFAPHGSGNVTIVNDAGINFAASTIGGVLTTDDTTAFDVGETISTGSIEGLVVLGTGGTNTVIYTGTERHSTSGAIFSAGGTIADGDANTRVISSGGVANGTLTATAATGNITQSGALKITGTSSFTTSGAGADITLENTSNNFFEGVSFNTTGSGGNVAVYDSTDFYLGASTINGNLEVETGNASGANIGDDGIVTVTGTTDLSASGTNNANVATIFINGFAHLFSGTLSAQGHHVKLKLGAATELGTIRAKRGNVAITISNGALTQSGPIQAVTDTVITASGQDVTLDNTSNSFGGNSNATITSTRVTSADEIKVTGANVVVASDHSFNVGASTVSGNLTLTSGAAENSDGNFEITDTGNVTVGGNFSATTNGNNGAIVMGTLEIDGTIALTTHGTGNATLDNGSLNIDLAASNVGGNLTVTSGNASGITDSGTVTVSGNLVATTDANSGVINLDSMAVDGTFTLSPHSTGAVTVVNDAGLDLAASTMGGTFSGTATTGNISDAGALAITGAATFITGATGSNIILDHASNAFSNSVEMRADAGGEAFGNITFVDSAGIDFATSAGSNGDLFINSSTDGTVGGNLSVTATTGNITDTVALAISGTSSFTTSASNATISLGTATNSFVGAVSFMTAGTTGDVALTTGTTALILGTSTMNGDLAVTADAAVTQSGALTILGTTTITATGNDVTLNNASNDFDSDDNSGNGRDVTITGKDVNIRDTDAIFLGRQTISGNLTVQAGGDIDDADALTVSGTTTITGGGAVKFNNDDGSDYTGPVNIEAGGAIVLKDENSIELGTITTTGTFTLTASKTTTGTVTQSGTITIGNPTTITNTGGDVTLTRATNNFGSDGSGSVKITGANVSITDANLIDLGVSTVSGSYAATAVTGNITDSGTLAITGLATFTTSASDATITLDETGSTFAAGASLNTTGSSGNATVDTGTNALDIAASTIGGTLTLTSGHASGITDSGTVTVGGNLVATTDANSGVINLDSMAVDGTFTLSPHSTGAVTVVNDAGLDLAASTMGGTFSGTATTGDISDAGALAITGAATFITGATGSNIILDVASNAFSSSVEMRADDGSEAFGNITFVDSAAVDFDSSASANGDLFINASTDGAVGGNLIVTATTGNITQNAALTVTGTTTLTTSANDATITLSNTSNAFTGAMTITTNDVSGDVTIDGGTTALNIGASTIDGDLTVTSDNASGIIDSGTVTVGGNLVATTDGNNGVIDLGTTTVTGTMDLTSDGSGNVTIDNANADIVLIASEIGGNLTLTTGNASGIIDSGNVTVGGNLIATTDANNGVIDLGTTTVTGTMDLTSDGSGNVTIDNANADIVLIASEIGGNLTLTTGNASGIIDSGNVTVGGNLIATTDANNGVIDLGTTTVTGTMDLTSHGSGDVTIDNANTDIVLIASEIGGNLTLTTGNASGIIDSGNVTVGGNLIATTDANNGVIDLGTTTVTGTMDLTSHGSGDVTIDNANTDIVLIASEIGGNLTLTTGNASGITDSGTVTVGGNLVATTDDNNGVINLDSMAVDGTFTLSPHGTGAVTIVNDAGLDLAASTLGGTFSGTATTGNITDTGALAITGTTTLVTSANDATITLDTSTNNFAGNVDLSTQGTSGHVTLVHGDHSEFLTFETSEVRGNLTVTTGTGGRVTQSGILTVDGTTDITATGGASNVFLNTRENVLTGAVSMSGHNVRLINSKAVELGTVSARALVITARGAVTQSGVITTVGDSNITAQNVAGDTNYDVTLENASNDFGGYLKLTAANASIRDTNAIELGESTVSGNYTLTAGGAVSDDGDLDIEGTTTISASGSNVVLDRATHDFTGAVAVEGATIELADANSIVLGTSNVSGTYTVTATTGNITQNATLTITGTTTLTTSANDATITLNNTSNAFTGAMTITTNDASGTDADVTIDGGTTALNIGASTIDGDLTVTSGNASGIIDSGNVTVGGNLIATTDANNGVIDLGTTTVTGTMDLTSDGSGNVTIDNANADIVLIASEIGGNLTLTTGNASGITDSGTVTVGGNLIATTDANNGVIDLGTTTVTGTMDLTSHGSGNVTIDNANADIVLIASEIGGNLTLTTGNASGITDSGTVTVGGNLVVTTDANNGVIDLGTTTVTGTMDLTSHGSGNVMIDNANADIVLIASEIGGNLTLTTGNASGITDSGTVTVGGNLVATTDDNNGVINLGTLAVEGTIALTTNDDANDDSAHATIVNNCSICSGGVGLNFVASTVEGNLTATATTGNITQNAALTIKGTSTLTTSANNATIVLDTTTNAFTGALTLTTNDDSGADADVTIDGGTTKLIIAASTIDGDLTIRTGNAADTSGITDSGTVTVGGNLSVTNDVDNGDIDMGSLAVTGSITLTTQGSGGNAAVVDASALDLAASTIGGTLNATATAGDITDSGQLTVTGAATFTAANNQSIYLDNLDSSNVLFGIHTFSSTVSFSSAGTLANVTVRDSTAFDFGAALTLASGGDLIVKSGGDVTQTGGALTVPGTTTIEASSNTVTLSNSSNNFTGAVSINALTVDLEDAGAIVLGASTVTGNYLVTAAGAVTQSGALGITGTTTISATGQNITLANTSNDFQNSVIVTGANVALVNADTIDLGTSTLSGTFDVTAKAGNITQSGNLTVTNASTFKTEATNGTILCGNPLCTSAGGTNAFSGAVKLTTTGSSAHAYIDNGTTALEIADETSVAGNLTLVSGHASGITDAGTLTVGGNLFATTDANNGVINLGGLVLSGKVQLDTVIVSNADTAQSGSTSTTVKLASGASSTDDFYNNMIVYISSGTGSGQLRTISDYVGSTRVATVSAWTTTPDATSVYEVRSSSGDATVVNTTNLDFIFANVGGDFIATATNGTITQDNPFIVGGTSDFHSVSSGNIILDSAANDFVGDVRFRGGAVVIKDTNDIEFGGGDSTAAGTLDGFALRVTAGDRITDDNTIPSDLKVTGGNAWFGTNNNSSNRIVLDSAGNVFSGTLTLDGGIGHIVSSSAAVVLTALTLEGDLRVTTTGGTVTDTGVLSVEGLTVISATDGAGNDFDVILDGDGTTFNNFQDEVQITGADIVLKDINSIELGKSTVSGTFDVTAGGTVTQNQLTANPLVITGVSTISGTDITLNNTANNFVAAIGVTTIGSDVVLVDTNAIVLGASTVTGTYQVTAGGTVTQSGALDIEGATTVEAGSNAVTLTNASNDFTSAVRVNGAAVQITDTNNLDLGTTTTTGAYTVIAGGGITDSGALTIGTTASAQTASFTAGNGKAIILDQVNASSNPVHDFSGALTFAASPGNLAGLTVFAVDAIDLAALTLVAAGGGDLAGNLSLKSGTVTQSGAWVVPGTTTVSSSGSDVTLGNTSNDFGGAVSVTGVDVTLVDANAIDLGASTVTGAYAVTATTGGGITDSGVLNITDTSTFTAAGGQSILLDQSSTFTSAVTFASGGTLADVSITDSNDFDLEVLTISGNLVVASGGSITQSGNLTIGGTSSFTTSSTNETITLSDVSSTNAFTGALTLSSTGANAHVVIDNGTTAIDIASASVGGNLTLTSGAAAGITDSGTVTVGGNLVATTDANNGVINMGNLAVDGSISLMTHGTGNATIINDAGLNLATSIVGGDLNATATTLNISDSGTLTVTGTTIITLGTNPILSVSGATSATDLDGFTITLDTANNLFAGGITLRYENVLPPDNLNIDLVRQMVFAELVRGLYKNLNNIYGAYENISGYDIQRMYELFINSMPNPKKEFKEFKKHLSNEFIIRKKKESIAEENENNEL